MAAKEKILVVDDEPSIRKYLQTLLEVDTARRLPHRLRVRVLNADGLNLNVNLGVFPPHQPPVCARCIRRCREVNNNACCICASPRPQRRTACSVESPLAASLMHNASSF